PYARKALDRLRRASWDVFFATNNSTATRLDYLGRLQRLGLGGDLDHIVTSGYATAHYLERRRPKPNDVLVIGADGLREGIRVVVVGDSTDYDMVAAHRVGAAGVLITTGLTERNALDTASGEAVPDRVIHSLEELFGLPEFAGS